MKGFERSDLHDSWYRVKETSNKYTAVIEFWTAEPEDVFDYGIWIIYVPPGKYQGYSQLVEDFEDQDDEEVTGDGTYEHLPFFTQSLQDFVFQNPEATIGVIGSEHRRQRLYDKFLTRYGFERFYSSYDDQYGMIKLGGKNG